MPILGIYASSMQPALNATSFESIATVNVGAGGPYTITFSSIPSTYKHLQVRAIAKFSSADNMIIRMNSDTGNNYAYHYLFGSGSAASSSGGSSANSIIATYDPSATSTYAGIVLDILDYANTSKYKTTRMLTGIDTNGGGNVALYSGLWQSTSAISTLTFTTYNANNMSQYSSFALYGVKG